MDIITYTHTVSLFFAPDSSLKGAEARRITGYEKLVDVPDAPGGKTSVFYGVEPEELIPLSADQIAAHLPAHAAMLAELAEKADVIKYLAMANGEMRGQMEAATARADGLTATMESQAATIEAMRQEAAAAKQEADQRDIQQRTVIAELREALSPAPNVLAP